MTLPLAGGLPAGVLLLGAAAGASLALTAVLRVLLLRLGSVDYPREDRWHRRVVARPGGPAMYVAWILLLMLLVPREARPRLLAVAGAASAVFALGLVDDLLRLSTLPKLLLLIVAACLPPLLGLRFELFPPALAVPLTIFWVLGITNAFNWLDNIDGLAAGTAAIAGGVLVAQFLLAGDAALAAGAALTAGVALGFLVFNVHPARIFMGDSGSSFLGFLLAVLPVAGSAAAVSNVVTTLIVPVLILSVPIFDTALVTLMRLRGGQPLLQGGTDHPSHRLVALGLSERRAVLNLYGLSALAGGVGLAASRLDPLSGLVLTAVALALFTALGFVLSRVRVSPRGGGGGGVGVVLVQLMHKRRILEMLVDVVLILAAYLGANLLRFEGRLPAPMTAALPFVLPVLVAIKMSVLYLMGLYRGEWRYVGFLDIVGLLRAVTLASLVSVTVLVLTTRLLNISRAALILDWLLTMVFLGGARFSIRLLQEMLAAQRSGGRPVLIFGAGEGGLLLLAEIRNNPAHGIRPVGFLDDDPGKGGTLMRGLPVLGTRRDIPELVRRLQIAEVLIAAPSMDRGDLEAVQAICAEAGVTCRAMHPLLS
ncbi:MAG: hypothetical protein HY334_03665 [Armatimonadetes bacterium]|nr:hypothetical protein [Armatimonadota bacterium]